MASGREGGRRQAKGERRGRRAPSIAACAWKRLPVPFLFLGLVCSLSHVFWSEDGTIPVDPSDDAGDGGGISGRVCLTTQAMDPTSHTSVRRAYTRITRPCHLQIPMVDAL